MMAFVAAIPLGGSHASEYSLGGNASGTRLSSLYPSRSVYGPVVLRDDGRNSDASPPGVFASAKDSSVSPPKATKQSLSSTSSPRRRRRRTQGFLDEIPYADTSPDIRQETRAESEASANSATTIVQTSETEMEMPNIFVEEDGLQIFPSRKAEHQSDEDASTKSHRRRRRVPSVHRCSRCGAVGHNVRKCPLIQDNSESAMGAWYRQRCSICGEPGHNAQTCVHNHMRQCRVCSGTGRLPCDACAGLGYLSHVMPASLPDSNPTPVRRQKLQPKVVKQPAPRQRAHGWAPTSIGRGGADDMDQGVSDPDGGVPGPRESTKALNLTDEQQRQAAQARARARNAVPQSLLPTDDDNDALVGHPGENHTRMRFAEMEERERSTRERCPRCTGLGHLSCMACNE